MLYTTYQLAENANACDRALDQWTEHVGGREKLKKTTKIPLTEILDVLGLDDCLWAMRHTCKGDTKTISVKFAIACADRVLIHYETKYPHDNRPRKSIEAAQNYLLQPATENASAAYAAANAAYAAAYAAYATYPAAYAASAAAYAAAYAASAAASAAANAASAAANAAYAAANAASAAAYATERKWQIAKLRELLEGI